ncbi:nucleoside deaminase [Arcanobacterium ihumii]|uniref:nucleoside deaminase n=1 Tax=Arcanobacterium ihumii TaxID=2138162 RepID=UPI001F30B50E|nr:nucleoside deaminase [Arcanobacterium ihumii]
MFENESKLMERAIELAEHAGCAGDVPVGAVVVGKNGEIIGEGFNTREVDDDPVGHAEVNALREAAKVMGTWNLSGCSLVVTLEPCTMCAGAIINSRISRVVFGAWDEKAGAAGSVRDVLRDARLSHTVEVVGGVCEAQTRKQLIDWFVHEVRVKSVAPPIAEL